MTSSIEIRNKFFVDSSTNEPFYIRGVDYQPGGASAVNTKHDPLSDPETCTRDIGLFNDLGINTVRVYSVNPDLDHDVCMTLLAQAGIYLVLDVNTPLEGQHLNRYEPWTTYTPSYLEHVFKVVKKFSHYNNTLAFFAGNEVINDEQSAENSPVFVKQLINDIHLFMDKQCPRSVPVGYSAADDLNYRVSLSRYLECDDPQFPQGSVDFYGVNTYQWCGDQDFESSAYDKLVSDYADYTKPVFFSEFGCNKVTPRKFQEIEALYSDKMFNTFAGGLVYEFSQEANDYGLVEIDSVTNGVRLLKDFVTLKSQLEKNPAPDSSRVPMDSSRTSKQVGIPSCEKNYENLGIDLDSPADQAKDLIKKGVDVKPGKIVKIVASDITNKYKVVDTDGNNYDVAYKFRDMQPTSNAETLRPTSSEVSRPKKCMYSNKMP
ncbi:hypothetical protein ACO0QE_000262 [Hanseniaspora vineae]